MCRFLTMNAALLALVGGAARGEDGKPASPRQFRISLRVAEIDVDSGKEKHVNEPCVTTMDGRPASFLIGGKMPFLRRSRGAASAGRNSASRPNSW